MQRSEVVNEVLSKKWPYCYKGREQMKHPGALAAPEAEKIFFWLQQNLLWFSKFSFDCIYCGFAF